MPDIIKKENISPIAEDLMEEGKFMDSLGKAKMPDLKKELEFMVACHNQQLDQLVRLRVDLESMDYLIIATPGDQKLTENRAETKLRLMGKRKIVKVIRSQITERVKATDGKKD